MSVGDYVNINGLLGILLDEPKNGLVTVSSDGGVFTVRESQLMPLTKAQEIAIKLYTIATIYDCAEEVEKLLSEFEAKDE